MNLKQRVYILLFSLSFLFLIYLFLSLALEGKLFYPQSYGTTSYLLGVTGALMIVLLMLFFFQRSEMYKKSGFFSKQIHLGEAIGIAFILLLASALGCLILNTYNSSTQNEKKNHYSIGIYVSESVDPLNFSDGSLQNPVLTAQDVSDRKARFIADPFLVYDNDTFYMFFEVFDTITLKGVIGLAESIDGFTWIYKQIVLEEPFHLSYPCVFRYENEYYMIPETKAAHSVRLYKALDFPYHWTIEKTLLEGQGFVDNTIFYYNETWWLFTESEQGASLFLYYADSLYGDWVEHPSNPIISNDANISRPGGNVIVSNGRIFRYTQDCYPTYGNQVWAFEITELTKDSYAEKRIGMTPLLKGYDSWNIIGMHQISILKIGGRWIAAVDGNGYY